MKIQLPFPPEPAHAHDLAELAVDAARHIDGIELDYSANSLTAVDTILLNFHNEGIPTDEIASAIFCMGCYTGEVFVCHADGQWSDGKRSFLGRLARNHWMVISLPHDREVNPIGKAFKRVESGESDSVVYLWHLFSRPNP